MKQEEAKTKWCPMARFADTAEDQNAANRWKKTPVPDSCCCLASDCMLWRWTSKEDNMGYCGLAVL